MDKTRKWMIALGCILVCAVVGFTLYKWLVLGTIDGGGIVYSFMSVAYLFNIMTWGDPHGGEQKDELNRYISLKSAKISYFVLMILSLLVLGISEWSGNFSDLDNYPLLIVVGLTFVVLPITEFFYSRKFK